MSNDSKNDCLWLEVSNVRTDVGTVETQVRVQLKGDRGDKEPSWWLVEATALGANASETAREIFKALDSKRIVLAGIKAAPKAELDKTDTAAETAEAVKTAEAIELVVGCIRILFSDTGSR